MSRLDWTVLLVYCAAILGVAIHFHRRASRGVVDFFVAGRNLPWWVIGFADVAGYTGGGQAFVMVFFLGGFSGLWLMAWVSWAIWMPLVAVLWAPMWSRLGLVTTGEFIERRYAGRRAAMYRKVYGLYACFAWGVTVLAYTSAWMLATTTPILGWSPARTLVVFGGMTIAYSLVSGLFAIAYNDVLQFVILIAGNGLFGWLLIGKAGGFATVLQKVNALQGTQFLQPWPTGGKLTVVSLIALCVQGLFFAGSPFAGEGWTAQRYMAARSEIHAVLGQMLNGVLALVIRMIPFLIIGLAAAAIYAPSQVATPAALWSDLVLRHAPSGLFGLLVVCSLAGYMATIASIGNWAASFIVNDVYAQIRPRAGSVELVRVSRLASGALLILAFAWGSAIDARQLERWVLFINSALVVFPLPLAWLKWFWWRTNTTGDMVGVLGAFPVGYLVWFGSDSVLPAAVRASIHSAAGWNIDGLVPAFSNLERYPFWLGFAILFGLGWISILAGTLFTRPEPMQTLKDFYLAARPIGWWGPVRATLTPAELAGLRMDGTTQIVACAWGILFYGALVFAFFSLLGGNFSNVAIGVPVAILSGFLFVRFALRR